MFQTTNQMWCFNRFSGVRQVPQARGPPKKHLQTIELLGVNCTLEPPSPHWKASGLPCVATLQWILQELHAFAINGLMFQEIIKKTCNLSDIWMVEKTHGKETWVFSYSAILCIIMLYFWWRMMETSRHLQPFSIAMSGSTWVSDTTRGSTGSPLGSRSSPHSQMFPASPDFQRSSRFWHLLPDFGTTLGQIRPHPIASSTCQVQDLEVHQLTVVGDKGANLGAMATWGFGELTKMRTQPVKMWSWGLALCIICIMLARNMQENIRKYFCWAGFRFPLKW